MNPLKPAGFTIVELLIALAIVGILLAVAAPAMRDAIMNNRISGQASDFIADVALARSETAKLGVRVTLCISSNGTACAGAGTDWGLGRIVFADTNGDAVVDAGDTIIKVRESTAGDNTLTATGFGNTYSIQFRPTGLLTHASGTLDLCDSRTGETGRRISVNNIGRAASANFTCP